MSKTPKKQIIQTPKGTHDMLPPEASYWELVVEKAKEISEFYGFRQIKTPHIEHAELFLRPLGETSEVVEKQMYTFRTKGGDLLALRPEGTASIVRAYHQNGMNSWPQPVKLYYEGAFFRHENPQRGRFREFRQFGMEILGSDDAVLDAEIIKISYLILKDLGFKNLLIHINSIGDKNCGPAYKKDLVNYYKKKFNYLCKDCKVRLKGNPLRLLDCKETGCIELKSQAPQMINSLCEPCRAHLKSVLEFLDEGGIPYFLNPSLVRGFDYYGRTVFEIFLEESRKETDGGDKPANENEEKNQPIALGGGGRYDDLSAILGGRPVHAVGASLGLERIIHELKKFDASSAAKKSEVAAPTQVFLIHIGPAAKKRAFTLMEEMRAAKIKIGESISKDNLKTQLNIASKVGARLALILGQKEAMDDTIIIRDMGEGSQESVLQNKLIEKIKAKLKKK